MGEISITLSHSYTVWFICEGKWTHQQEAMESNVVIQAWLSWFFYLKRCIKVFVFILWVNRVYFTI
jgi:hypothetical protein